MMKHYARLDDDDRVIELLELDDDDTLDQSLVECDPRALEGKLIDFSTGELIEGSALRKNYPGVGWKYNRDLDLFEMPCAFPSWTLNADTGVYQAPKPYPEDSTSYSWNEELGDWEPVDIWTADAG